MCTAPSITTAYLSPMRRTSSGLYGWTAHRKNICQVGPWQEVFCASGEHGRQLKDATIANFKASKEKASASQCWTVKRAFFETKTVAKQQQEYLSHAGSERGLFAQKA